MAAAPSLRISTRSTASMGTRAARSTKLEPSSVCAADRTCRLPLSKTSVDATPSPAQIDVGGTDSEVLRQIVRVVFRACVDCQDADEVANVPEPGIQQRLVIVERER